MRKKFFLAVLISAIGFHLPSRAEPMALDSPLMQEEFFTTLVYDYSKSFAKAFRQNGAKDWEADLNVTYLKTQIDMLKIKKEAVKCFKKNNLGFHNQPIDIDKVNLCMKPFIDEMYHINNYLKQNPGSLEQLMAAYAIAPRFETPDNNNLLSTVMSNSIKKIAYSRLNTKYWYNEIIACIKKDNLSTDERINLIPECSVDYFKLYNKEMEKIAQELLPYKEFYQNIIKAPRPPEIKENK